jgi:hypothetical protein
MKVVNHFKIENGIASNVADIIQISKRTLCAYETHSETNQVGAKQNILRGRMNVPLATILKSP